MSNLLPSTGNRLPSRVRRQLSEIERDALVVAEQMLAGQFLHQTAMHLDTDTHRLAELLSRGNPIHASRLLHYEDSQSGVMHLLLKRWAFRQ